MSLKTRLFVGNLPENTNENDLLNAFSTFGEIINLDLKSKSTNENEVKKFAFITLSASNENIESCIGHFSQEDFKDNKLYVTRARESFLERLQREREQIQQKEKDKQNENLPKKNPIIKLSEKLNPRKRKIDTINMNGKATNSNKSFESKSFNIHTDIESHNEKQNNINLTERDKKKLNSDQKRMDALRQKRLEFKQKQNIIKTGLINTDKIQNKKVVFSDSDEDVSQERSDKICANNNSKELLPNKNTLFESDDSDFEFEIKKQYEGIKGQKILDLQSRYKSDKRFVLDEKFIDNESEEENEKRERENKDEETGLEHNIADEKSKQLKILQDVLGVDIKVKTPEFVKDNKKTKSKFGMIRFDPTNPDHAKFLALTEGKTEIKKSKKRKSIVEEETVVEVPVVEEKKIIVSKEQFYKVSETLKETIAQPATFSLRSLFHSNDTQHSEEQELGYTVLETSKKTKQKNPLDPGIKNPFVYDSTDEEEEEDKNEVTESALQPMETETKAVWKENLFFDKFDYRFKEGLAFFNKPIESNNHKERRELKSLMKKRIYNTERKNQMFQKKIGGRRKSSKSNKKFRHK